MATIELEVQRRQEAGKQISGQLRRSGFLPAVLYGRGQEPVKLSVATKPFTDLLSHHGPNAVLRLTGEGSDQTAMIKTVQRHPVKGIPQTIDLIRVSRDEKISVTVPLVLEGEHPAVKSGEGVLVQSLLEVEIAAKPDDIPSSLSTDISGLELGGSALTLAAVTLPEGVDLVTDPETAIAAVNFPLTDAQEGGEAPIDADADSVPSEHGDDSAPSADETEAPAASE